MFDIIMVVFQTPILKKKTMYIKKLHVVLKKLQEKLMEYEYNRYIIFILTEVLQICFHD